MRRSFWCLVLAVPLLAGVQAADAPLSKYEQWRRQRDFAIDVIYRALELRPGRRDEPLREINITDNEIREIQQRTRSYLPNSYVNISPVVTGCPCEEGPACTDQVFVLADAGAHTLGLQLSRVNDRWVVGEVQKWWLAYERFLTRDDWRDRDEYYEAEYWLTTQFPVCPSPAPAATVAVSPGGGESRP